MFDFVGSDNLLLAALAVSAGELPTPVNDTSLEDGDLRLLEMEVKWVRK